MTDERWRELSFSRSPAFLTPEEIAEGWHFCPDWDYALISEHCPEKDSCLCKVKNV